jgi:hypothetical protein
LKRLTLLIGLTCLAACSSEEEMVVADTPAATFATQTRTEATEPASRPVRVAITLGEFESRVTDLAALEVAPFGFQSLVYAANGDTGIAAVQADGQSPFVIETERTPFQIATMPVIGGGLLLSVSRDGYLEIYPAQGGDRLVGEDVLPDAVADLCAGPAGDDGMFSFSLVTEAGGIRSFELTEDEGALTVEDLASEDIGGVTGCTVVGGRTILRGSGTWGSSGGAKGDGAVLALESGGEIYTLTASPEGLRSDGQTIELTDDRGEPLRPQQVQVARGNFGGVLRDGAVIVLDERRGLHLFPWSAVADQLGAPRRLEGWTAALAEEDSLFDFGDQASEIMLEKERPGFEDRALPEPPGR